MANFEELGLKPAIVKAITEMGFEAPMPIQEKAIPVLLTNHTDIIALAQTGTGKTAAFGLPLLNAVDENDKRTQAVILCPTRELCLQISKDLENFAKYLKGVSVLAVYGGASIEMQIRELKRGVQIIVATPGRMNDLIRRGKTDISNIDTVVLDEADEMLNMGFQEELNAILSETPDTKRTVLFSATMPREVASIAAKYMKNPLELAVGKKNAGAENVEHHYYMVHAHDRYQALKRIADVNPDVYGIIFCRTRQETREIAEKLIKDGYNADALHGDLSQQQRDQVMQRFRIKNLQMLIATDVAARGIDVEELTHVINYNLPDEIEAYTHRSGRTGRAGKSGISISIIHMKEQGKIWQLERIIQKKFIRKNIPTGKEICERQLMGLIDRVQKEQVDESHIAQFMGAVLEKFDGMSSEEIIKRFVAAEFNRFAEYYKNAPDLNVPDTHHRAERTGRFDDDRFGRSNSRGGDRNFERSTDRGGDRGSRFDRDRTDRGPRFERGEGGSRARVQFAKFSINIGSEQGIKPGNLIGVINENTRERKIVIGRATVGESSSIFEADAAYTQKILSSFDNAKFGDKKLKVSLAGNAATGAPRNKYANAKNNTPENSFEENKKMRKRVTR